MTDERGAGASREDSTGTEGEALIPYGQSSFADDEIETYSVKIDKGAKFRYGIAYRVIEEIGVTLMGVLADSPADVWNTICDPNQTLCAGDTIISANQQRLPRAIVDELLGSSNLHLHIQKTGPRWHIIGEGAKPKETFVLQTPVSPGSGQNEGYEKFAGGLDAVPEEEAQREQDLHLLGYVYLFSALFGPNLVMLVVFSDVGFGIKTFTAFSSASSNMQGNAVVFLGSMAAVGLVVFDWSKWKSKKKKIGCLLFVAYFICLGALLKCRFYPFAPLVIIIFHTPIFLGILKGKVLANVKRKSFYIGVTISAFSCALFVMAVWLLWMNVDAFDGSNQWGDATKERLVLDSEAMYDNWKVTLGGRTRSLNYFWDCAPDSKQKWDYKEINAFKFMDANFTLSKHQISATENQDRAAKCARVKTVWFLTWTTPMICFMIDMIIAVFCLCNGVLINISDTSRLEKTLKQFILMICFLIFMMYVSSSVAGASMKLTGVIMAFCASGMVALCVWLYMEVGRQAITSQVRNSKLMQSLIVLATSDWVRACVLIGTNALIPTFLCVNIINQRVRKMRGLAKKDDPKYTSGANRIIMAVQTWNWASILVKANWLVILYWTFSVGVAKLTYVFLSWLNETLLLMEFGVVIGMYFLIGFIMFMLPPVPGIPVYIVGGILLSARARDIEGVGFWGGMVIAIFESVLVKICAVCGQYTIGFYMGKSVKVQQLVSVDKVFTRAIEKVLDTRGLNLPKVSVLVGGPDWPTSVLCGILKLNLLQCCLGTVPVILVSSPCVIAGAFLSNPGLKSNDAKRRLSESTTTPTPGSKGGEAWSTLSTTALALSFMMQLAGMILALYYIQEVVHRQGEELAKPRPEHEAVAALTRKEADYVQQYNEVIAWPTMLKSRRRLISASTAAMLLSTFMFVMMDEACFRPFAVSSKISDPYDQGGLNGSVLNLVMPTGWFANFCFLFASSLHFAFLKWAGKEAHKRLDELLESRPPPVDDEEDEDQI